MVGSTFKALALNTSRTNAWNKTNNIIIQTGQTHSSKRPNQHGLDDFTGGDGEAALDMSVTMP